LQSRRDSDTNQFVNHGLYIRGGPSTNTLHLAYSNWLCSLDDERRFVVDEVIFAILSPNFVLPHRVF